MADHNTYVFSHGPELLAVLTSGNFTPDYPRPAAYSLRGLDHMAGAALCDALGSGVSCPGQRPAARRLARHAKAWASRGCGSAVAAALCHAGCYRAPMFCLGPTPPPAPTLALQICVTVSQDGAAEVPPSPANEPLILVTQRWLRPAVFFQPVEARPVSGPGPAQGLVLTRHRRQLRGPSGTAL